MPAIQKRALRDPAISRDRIAELARTRGLSVELLPSFYSSNGHKYPNRKRPTNARRLKINGVECSVHTVRTRNKLQGGKGYAQASLKRPKNPTPLLVYHVVDESGPERIFIVKRFDIEKKFVGKINIPLHSEVWCGYGFKWHLFENAWGLFVTPSSLS